MTSLFRRVERLEDRQTSGDDVAVDAQHFAERLEALAGRFEDSDRFRSEAQKAGWSPAMKAAWRMRFLSETPDAAVVALSPEALNAR